MQQLLVAAMVQYQWPLIVTSRQQQLLLALLLESLHLLWPLLSACLLLLQLQLWLRGPPHLLLLLVAPLGAEGSLQQGCPVAVEVMQAVEVACSAAVLQVLQQLQEQEELLLAQLGSRVCRATKLLSQMAAAVETAVAVEEMEGPAAG